MNLLPAPSAFSSSLDGRPSDGHRMKKSYWPDLTEVPRSLAQRFRKRFTFVVVELAGADIDFTVLLNMAEAARNAGAASGDFRRVNLDATELSLAVSIAAISSTLARTELAGACRAERTLRVDVVKKIGGVTCFEPKDYTFTGGKVVTWNKGWETKGYQHPIAAGIAFSRTYFGEGAERRTHSIQKRGRWPP